MLLVTDCQGNANQDGNEIPLHPVRMSHIRKDSNNECWRGCGDKGALLHAGGNVSQPNPVESSPETSQKARDGPVL